MAGCGRLRCCARIETEMASVDLCQNAETSKLYGRWCSQRLRIAAQSPAQGGAAVTKAGLHRGGARPFRGALIWLERLKRSTLERRRAPPGRTSCWRSTCTGAAMRYRRLAGRPAYPARPGTPALPFSVNALRQTSFLTEELPALFWKSIFRQREVGKCSRWCPDLLLQNDNIPL